MVDLNQTRLLPAVPVVERVPLIVCLSLICIAPKPAAAGPVTERLLKTFAPVIVLVFVALVLV